MIKEDLKEREGEKRSLTVERVELRGFRNYRSLEVSLDAGFNLIAGPNGQGKTNFLEALYLLSTTRLLRGQRDAEAVLDGETQAYAACELSSHTELSVLLESGVRKRAAINGAKLPKASDLIGRLPCVCISSFDLAIVRDEPSDRRLFLDLELSSLYPAYLKHLAVYKRALEQRNALLRDSREWSQPAELFETWEEQIAASGSAIREARIRYVEELEPVAKRRHEVMGQGEDFSMSYVLKGPELTKESFIDALARTRPSDIARGGTSVGPHRDDLAIVVNGRDARLFGSQGQQRTSVIAIKLATLDIQRSLLGHPPLLLLDDILSDLDERRRGLLVDVVLAEAGQTVLTCTEASAAGAQILERARVFQVENGKLF